MSDQNSTSVRDDLVITLVEALSKALTADAGPLVEEAFAVADELLEVFDVSARPSATDGDAQPGGRWTEVRSAPRMDGPALDVAMRLAQMTPLLGQQVSVGYDSPELGGSGIQRGLLRGFRWHVTPRESYVELDVQRGYVTAPWWCPLGDVLDCHLEPSRGEPR